MNFWKTFLASWLAIFVSAVGLGVFGMIFLVAFITTATSSLMGGDVKIEQTKPNTNLVMNFGTPISDSKVDNPAMQIDIFSMTVNPNITSFEVLNSIYSAIADENITQITLNMSRGVSMSLANMCELRSALELFKKEGKKIVSYSDHYTQATYYLASVADEVYLYPTGAIEWVGLSSVTPFFKGLLDNLDVEVEVFKYGKYKSAVEPFILKGMSDESRQQSERTLNNLWGQMVKEISISRNISVEELNKFADELTINSPEDALKAGLIDGLRHGDEVSLGDTIRKFNDYLAQETQAMTLNKQKDKVELIYADGEIVSGKSNSAGTLGDITLVAKINKAKKDKDVKAIVIRVNSPGGSALASDIVNRAVVEAKKVKPVIVSMGAMAASGGYYISANADAIVASPYTITGSIGVFGLTFNATKPISGLGVSFDVVKTNTHSDMGGMHRSLDKKERMFLQNNVNSVYEDFVNVVSSGRKMTFEEVDKIAQGRVWTASDALELGLIDKMGGIIDAIELAAFKADLTGKYSVYVRSAEDDLLTEVVKILNSSSVNILIDNYISSRNPATALINKEWSRVERLMKGDKIQAITPFYFNL